MNRARKDNVVVKKLQDETLVYDLKRNKAYCLNETSALVWELCDGKRSIADISAEVSSRLKGAVSEDFVRIALDQLNKNGLLKAGAKDYFGNMSRREVVRRVGFSSVAALPIVSYIVAPEAAMAQSCLPLGQNRGCTSNAECCSSAICIGTPGHCCSSSSTGANGPGFRQCLPTGTVCSDVAAFAGRCCSGVGFPFTGAFVCPVGEDPCECSAFV